MSLLDLSARIGSDPMLIQGCNGNTSIKINEVLWIKASGKCLANALREEMLVPVPFPEAQQMVNLDWSI